jgi:glycosyltransferase involved in cell wall biosynthesis
MKINIISRDNGSGLTQDAEILRSVFEPEGCKVHFFCFDSFGKPPPADVNIFLELFSPNLCNAPKNYLIPNQEWFMPNWIKHLPRLTGILAKTYHAYNIFNPYVQTEYISFTSRDVGYIPYNEKTRGFVHIRGRSRTKGTIETLQAWTKVKNAPKLLFHSTREWDKTEQAKMRKLNISLENVERSTEKLPIEGINKIIQESKIHLCLSPCEGFGHYINEAMSAGGIVVTTDAPPMNELVNPSAGFRVSYSSSKPFNFSTAYKVNVYELTASIQMMLKADDKFLQKKSKAARKAYEKRDRFFRERIKQIIL